MSDVKQPNDYRDLNNFKIPIEVLIFNHKEYADPYPGFVTPKPRDGSDKDVEMMKGTIDDFYKSIKVEQHEHFKEVQDLTFEDIKSEINFYAEKDYKNVGCLMIVVLTHGMKGGILLAQDQSYHASKIWDPIINSPKLKGVPKIFIFQACRSVASSGDIDEIQTKLDPRFAIEDLKENHDNLVPSGNEHEAAIYIPQNEANTGNYLPNADDVIVAYSTVEDRSAVRSCAGTWYIGLLSQNLRNWNQRSLHSILTEVTRNMIEKHSHTPEDKNSQDESKSQEEQIFHSVSNTKNNEVSKLEYSQTATFVSYLKQDIIFKFPEAEKRPPPTSPVDHTPKIFKIDNLESDASDGVVVDLNKLPDYRNDNTYQGIFYIFHDKDHASEALELEDVATKLNCLPITNLVQSKSECYIYLMQEATRNDFKDDNILFVAYLGTFDETKHFQEELVEFKKPFNPLRCTTLAGKPIVLMFIDVHEAPISAEQSDGQAVNQYATENSDFLIIRSSGKGFLKILLEKLGLFLDSNQDLVSLLTECRKNYCNDLPNDTCRVKPHFESTLIRLIVLTKKSKAHTIEERQEKQRMTYGLEDCSASYINRPREKSNLLSILKNRSDENGSPLIDVLIHGNEGVGKTQFISNFTTCEEVKSEYPNRLVFNASSEEKLVESLNYIKVNNNVDTTDFSLCDLIAKKCIGKTLIVFDNYNSKVNLENYFKINQNFFYIAVSREIDMIKAKEKMHIKDLDEENCKELVLELLKINSSNTNDSTNISLPICNEDQAKQIVTKFGQNPLVLSLVCAYVNNQKKINFSGQFDINSCILDTTGVEKTKIPVDISSDEFYKTFKSKYNNLEILLQKHFEFEISTQQDDNDEDFFD